MAKAREAVGEFIRRAEQQAKKVELDVTPSPEAREALALRDRSVGIVVTDKASHSDALEFIKAAKRVQRNITEHWQRITRAVDALKANLLTLKRQDLQPVEDALEIVERSALSYENEERQRAQEEQDRERRESEERARVQREKELARLEADALRAEASSPDLSARETHFVLEIVAGAQSRAAAKAAGYKDPEATGAKLLASDKIKKAIAIARQALEMRRQADARREQPLEIDTRKVEPNLGRAAGTSTRTTYSAEVVNLEAFNKAVRAGVIPLSAIEPNGPELNREAKRLKELFEQAYPGCRLVKDQGISG